MKFTIEKRHIDQGIKGDCHRCPAALCLIETLNLNKDRYCEVGAEFIYLDEKIFTTPEVITDFISAYDWSDEFDYISFEPFEFELSIPDSLLRS